MPKLVRKGFLCWERVVSKLELGVRALPSALLGNGIEKMAFMLSDLIHNKCTSWVSFDVIQTKMIALLCMACEFEMVNDLKI